MATLHFDFTQDATRAYILATLRKEAGDYLASDIDRHVKHSHLPQSHIKNLDEVHRIVRRLIASRTVKENINKTYGILAEAEAQVHGCKVKDTHFHEVGEASTFAEIVEIFMFLCALNPTKITATAVQVGSGKVECAHGTLDIPAPATKAILDSGIPIEDHKGKGELCTPTSAALIKCLVDEFV